MGVPYQKYRNYYTFSFKLAPNEVKTELIEGDFITVYDVIGGASLDDIEIALDKGELVKASTLLPATSPFRKVTVKNNYTSDIEVKFLIGFEFYRGLQQGVRILADQSTITARLNDILAQLDVALSTRASESTLSSILAQLDITLSALRDALLGEEHVYSQTINADETVAQSITLDTKGHKLLEVWAEASAATTFTLEFSNDNTNWVTYYTSATAETEYKKTLWCGFRYVRLSSAAAGAAGDTVTLILSAK